MADVKWDKDKPTDTVGDTIADTAIGVGTGAALDFDDEIVGGIHAIGKAFGLSKKGYTEGRDEYRDRKALAGDRSPIMNGLGQLGGGVAVDLATGGGALVEQGAIKAGSRLAAGGALQGIGADETGTVSGMAKNAVEGAGLALAAGGMVHGAGSLAVHGAEAVNPELATSMVNKGLNHRLHASGQNPEIVKKEPGGIPGRVKRMDNMGIGTGIESTAQIKTQAEKAFKEKDALRQGYIKRLDEEGATVSGPAVGQRYRKRAAELGGNDPVAIEAKQRVLRREARELEGKGKNQGQPAKPGQERAPWAAIERQLKKQDPLKTPPAMVEKKAAEQAKTVRGVKPQAEGGPKPTERIIKKGAVAKAATPPEPPPVPPDPNKMPGKGADVIDQAKAIRAAQLRQQAAAMNHDSVVSGQRRMLHNEARDFEAQGDMPFSQIDKKRAYYGRNAHFVQNSENALLRQGRHHDVSDAMHASAMHHDPVLGSALKEESSNEAAAIHAMEGADSAVNNSSKKGGPRGLFNHGVGAAAAAAGYKVGGPALAAPMYVAGVVGAQGMGGRPNSAAALAYKHGANAVLKSQRFIRPLARAMQLAKAPVASAVGRVAVAHAMKVARAKTPEKQAQDHYSASFDPIYRKVVMHHDD